MKRMQKGSTFLDEGQYEKALHCFKSALRYDLAREESAHNYRNLALSFLHLNQVDSAKYYSKKGMDCTVKLSYYHLINMAEYDLLSGHVKLARSSFEEALRLKPNDAEAEARLSLIYGGIYATNLENRELARKHAHAALKSGSKVLDRDLVDQVYKQANEDSDRENLH